MGITLKVPFKGSDRTDIRFLTASFTDETLQIKVTTLDSDDGDLDQEMEFRRNSIHMILKEHYIEDDELFLKIGAAGGLFDFEFNGDMKKSLDYFNSALSNWAFRNILPTEEIKKKILNPND